MLLICVLWNQPEPMAWNKPRAQLCPRAAARCVHRANGQQGLYVLRLIAPKIHFCRPLGKVTNHTWPEAGVNLGSASPWLSALCPWHKGGLQGHLGRGGHGKDAAVMLESPGRSCKSSRHLGRQIVKAKMKMAKLPVLKGCPGGRGAGVERLSMLFRPPWKGLAGSQEEGGTAGEEGFLSEMPCETLCTHCKRSCALSF